MGFPTHPNLGLVGDIKEPRSADEIVDRLLCLYCAASCAYGFDRKRTRAWLEKEKILFKLTKVERRFVVEAVGEPTRFIVQIEAMWALAWALGMVNELDFSSNCSDSFADMLPHLRAGEDSSGLRSRVKLRPHSEVIEAADLAYCLHWAIREAQITDAPVPGKVQPFVTIERRRALQWLIGDEPWDEVPMDT